MTKDSDSPKLVVKRVALHSVALIFLVNIVLSFVLRYLPVLQWNLTLLQTGGRSGKASQKGR